MICCVARAEFFPAFEVDDLCEGGVVFADVGSDAVLGFEDVGGSVGEFDGVLLWEDHDAVVVCEEPVSGSDGLSADGEGDVDFPQAVGIARV